MPQFTVDGFFIVASDEAEAKRVIEKLKNQKAERLLMIEKGDRTIIVELDDQPTRIYTRYKSSINYCGEIKFDSGMKILEAAIASVDIAKTEAAKLGQLTKSVNQKRRHDLDKKDIDLFCASVPEIAKGLFQSIMLQIGAHTDAYQLEIIDGLAGIQIKPENWMPILIWFRDKVLKSEEGLQLLEKKSHFQLRKAFVTAASRMARGEVRHSNTMRGVKDDGREPIDWIKYAQDKAGS